MNAVIRNKIFYIQYNFLITFMNKKMAKQGYNCHNSQPIERRHVTFVKSFLEINMVKITDRERYVYVFVCVCIYFITVKFL